MAHDKDKDEYLHEAELPPDQAAAGDVTTTGHSAQDERDVAHAHEHDPHAVHEDVSDVPTLVDTTWRQLLLPALILVLVGILVAGPVVDAFATRPAASPGVEERTEDGEHGASPAPITETPQPAEQGTPAASPTLTAQPPTPEPTPEETAEPQTTPTTSGSLIATQTAVAQAGEEGTVARVPVQVEFGGTTYVVKPGTNLLPDWKPSDDVGIATWIEGTFLNHILYLPYNPQNKQLFQAAAKGESVRVTMNTGQVFVFTVTRSERVVNGPPSSEGQFTVSTAMRQDHAGITLFLVGDPADDRAVVQADFTGLIQQ